MRLLLPILVVVLTGCGTINSRTLEYCDNEQRTLVGIPLYTTADCISVSNSESGSGVEIPEGVPE